MNNSPSAISPQQAVSPSTWKLLRLRMVSVWYSVSVGHRLLILGLLSLTAIAFPLYIYVTEANKTISTAKNEVRGVPVIQALFHAMKALQEHRAYSTTFSDSSTDVGAPRKEAAERVEKAYAELHILINEGGRQDSLGGAIQTMVEDWKALRSDVEKGGNDPSVTFEAHSRLIGQVPSLILRVGDEYEQTLDPDIETLHLALLSVMNLSSFIDYLGELRGNGTAILAKKSITENERRRLMGKVMAARTILQRGSYSAERATSGKNTEAEKVAAAYEKANNSAASVLVLVDRLSRSQAQDGSPEEFFKAMTVALDAQFELADVSQSALGDLVQARKESLVISRNVLCGGILLLTILAGFVSTLISLSISGPFTNALEVCENISKGFVGQTINVRGTDEMARLRLTMKNLQDALSNFVDELNLLSTRQAEGDLSHRINEEAFAGAFREAAARLNKLVDQQNSEMMRNFTLVGSYANGNFAEDFEALPGEKAVISNNVSRVKGNLSALNAEIQALVGAATRGDFAQRGDVDKYSFEFKDMVSGLNQLMQAADAGLSDVGATLNLLASADLTHTMTGEYEGKFAELQGDTNKMVGQLVQIVASIREASDAIATGSKEIAKGTEDLSQRTEDQASSLEETASAMKELTSTVKQNAENARQANQLAAGASEVAVKGGDMVKQVVTTMNGISESSKKIADIIGTIDGIAFQTNILALNAAVEAARAGEQGRGFAVVATEVRNLAQRSAAAAKEIKGLITDSVSKVDVGAQLVDDAGKTMDEIVTSVKRVTDIIAEITAASQEQSSGIEQVNQAITQMDEVTQQNAALVEQATAAAESMQEQAAALVQTVAIFRISGEPARGKEAPAVERRGPQRATNVERLSRKPATRPARTAGSDKTQVARKAVGDDSEWTEF